MVDSGLQWGWVRNTLAPVLSKLYLGPLRDASLEFLNVRLPSFNVQHQTWKFTADGVTWQKLGAGEGDEAGQEKHNGLDSDN